MLPGGCRTSTGVRSRGATARGTYRALTRPTRCPLVTIGTERIRVLSINAARPTRSTSGCMLVGDNVIPSRHPARPPTRHLAVRPCSATNEVSLGPALAPSRAASLPTTRQTSLHAAGRYELYCYGSGIERKSWPKRRSSSVAVTANPAHRPNHTPGARRSKL